MPLNMQYRCDHCGQEIFIKDFLVGANGKRHKTLIDCDNAMAKNVSALVEAAVQLQDKRRRLGFHPERIKKDEA